MSDAINGETVTEVACLAADGRTNEAGEAVLALIRYGDEGACDREFVLCYALAAIVKTSAAGCPPPDGFYRFVVDGGTASADDLPPSHRLLGQFLVAVLNDDPDMARALLGAVGDAIVRGEFLRHLIVSAGSAATEFSTRVRRGET